MEAVLVYSGLLWVFRQADLSVKKIAGLALKP
jgi:hypothetical protein